MSDISVVIYRGKRRRAEDQGLREKERGKGGGLKAGIRK